MNDPAAQIDGRKGGTVQVTTRLLRLFLPGEVRWLFIGLILLLLASGVTLLQPWPLKLVLDSVVGQVPLPNSISWLTHNAYFSSNPKIFLLTVLCVALLLV